MKTRSAMGPTLTADACSAVIVDAWRLGRAGHSCASAVDPLDEESACFSYTWTSAIDHLDDGGYCSWSARPPNLEPGSRMRQSRRVNTGNRRDTTARRWRPWLWPDTPARESAERALSPTATPSEDRAPVRDRASPDEKRLT